jgi:hypothetical protein
MKQTWQELGARALPVFVTFVGLGLILTNLLSRNNSFDKCIVSIALASRW